MGEYQTEVQRLRSLLERLDSYIWPKVEGDWNA